ncbi:uncharacterized protein N7469_009702 [Penicillium citrinum]|uniref:Uncharacterized protein n=2 Tax=Penicillium TaxID=5073 RepID=A0A9W9NIX0_PENCI|nr:uncharacterized protein N7469_009702 [Penicillium citrinum]KAJ5220815.1 hypothetical protein N7469_009702 [Penicillium citrinum]
MAPINIELPSLTASPSPNVSSPPNPGTDNLWPHNYFGNHIWSSWLRYLHFNWLLCWNQSVSPAVMRAHEQAASTNEPGKKWYTKSLHCFTSKKNQKGKSKAGSDQAPCAAPSRPLIPILYEGPVGSDTSKFYNWKTTKVEDGNIIAITGPAFGRFPQAVLPGDEGMDNAEALVKACSPADSAYFHPQNWKISH